MKHLTLTLMVSVAAITTLAQNLVPNPSFEEYLECPFSTAELDNQVVDWYSWQMTPDFFNPCSDEIDGFVGVPENVWGYQWPITGESYVAVITFEDHNPGGREYIAAQLTDDLVPGQSYYLMFHASLCDGGLNLSRKCATNNIGMRFFKDPNYTYFPPNQEFVPDNFTHLNSSEIIVDDVNWIKIEGWFTADDNYNWLALGNFFDDNNTATSILNDEEQCWGYYFIENICVAQNPADCDYLVSTDHPSKKYNSLRVYPNPSTYSINVELISGSIEELVISDIKGKEISRYSSVSASSINIDVARFEKGVYVLSVYTKKQRFTHKIIVK